VARAPIELVRVDQALSEVAPTLAELREVLQRREDRPGIARRDGAVRSHDRLPASLGCFDVADAVLADDPNFTVTAPALQQAIQDNLGLTVELIGLPTAPYVELIQGGDEWDIFLSFGGSEGVGWYQSQQYYSCESTGATQLKLSEERGECDLYDPLFAQAAAVVGDAQTAILTDLGLKLNENLPEIYLWQPNYLHVYSDRLGGGFTIYPNERESFQKILDWTYAP
jgi:ABC-type transport system substrate-binding protein